MRLIHLSHSTRASGNPGGVEKFGWYLQRATGCEVVTSLDGGLDPAQTLVVADFHHSMNVPQPIPVICMIHGVMKELAIRVGKVNDFQGVIDSQHQACRRDNTYYVASSPSAKTYAVKHHGLGEDKITVIPHGVDPELFPVRVKPAPLEPYIVIHAATDYVKNHDLVHQIGEALDKYWPGQYLIEFLGAKIGEEPQKFSRGHVYIHPSHYEGDSYACIEALMSGVPIVVSASGRFENSAAFNGGYVLYRMATPDYWAAHIGKVITQYANLTPRAWALEFAGYDRFAAKWCRYIDRVKVERGMNGNSENTGG